MNIRDDAPVVLSAEDQLKIGNDLTYTFFSLLESGTSLRDVLLVPTVAKYMERLTSHQQAFALGMLNGAAVKIREQGETA